MVDIISLRLAALSNRSGFESSDDTFFIQLTVTFHNWPARQFCMRHGFSPDKIWTRPDLKPVGFV